MAASTTTTIRGVSIFSRQRKRKADVFDIALSPEGIAIQRPGRSDQYMGWDRVTQWEIEERPGCVVLTLRGGGSVTPLMVKDWTLEDLETVMRDTTAGSRHTETTPTSEPELEPESEPKSDSDSEPAIPTDVDAITDDTPAPVGEPEALAHDAAPLTAAPQVMEPLPPRSARRQTSRRPASRRQSARRQRRSAWRPVVTVVLLGVLAAAVIVVLLQSAGVIDWSFLGPTA